MKNKVLLIFSLVSSACVIVFELLQWEIVELVTPFFMPLLWVLVFGFFLIITVIVVIGSILTKTWKPVVVQLITGLLWFFFPFTQIALNIDYKIHKAERQEVVTLVDLGALQPNVSYTHSVIHLPDSYSRVSKGGDIVVEQKGSKHSILFLTFRGVLDNFSGFVYSPDDSKPGTNDFGGDFKEVNKIETNWYFVASY